MLMVYSPSLRRHYPDQVPRVVLDQDSQPRGSPGYVQVQYSTFRHKVKAFHVIPDPISGIYPFSSFTTAMPSS